MSTYKFIFIKLFIAKIFLYPDTVILHPGKVRYTSFNRSKMSSKMYIVYHAQYSLTMTAVIDAIGYNLPSFLQCDSCTQLTLSFILSG